MASSSRFAIPAQASIRSVSSAFSRLSTPRSPAEWGWGCRFAGPSSKPMGAACGRIRINLEALLFGSHSRVRKMSSRIESRAKAPFQLLVVNWFAKITDNSFPQSAGARLVIGIGCYQDRRNRAPCLDEVPIKFDSRHSRHLNVGDQAGGFDESR